MQALVLNDLTKVYDNGVAALSGINLRVQQGDFFALLGPNGAGKSTTIGIITSLIRKTRGTVHVFDYSLDQAPGKVKSLIGLVPQEINLSIFEKILDLLLYQAGFYGVPLRLAKQRAEFYLKKLDLWDKRKQPAMRLSGGMKRRLMIARALLHEPKLLILDEPTAGVDIEIRRTMWDFLRQMNQKGTTIILTTHYLEEAESLCKNIAILNQGRIIKDTSMKQLLAQLHIETFILDLKHSLDQIGPSPFVMRLLDHHTLEVDLDKRQTMNDLFGYLHTKNIEVLSMRNKANRLEELFLQLTHQQFESI